MNPREIVNQEIIGLHTNVVSSTDPTLISRGGLIIDETRETIRVLDNENELTIAKTTCVFDLVVPSGFTVRVDGHHLRGVPEDRLKMRLRRRW